MQTKILPYGPHPTTYIVAGLECGKKASNAVRSGEPWNEMQEHGHENVIGNILNDHVHRYATTC